jgi:hypothetical protein
MEIEASEEQTLSLSLSLSLTHTHTHTRNRGLQVVCVSQAKENRESRYSRHSATEGEITSLSLETTMQRDTGSMKTERNKGSE